MRERGNKDTCIPHVVKNIIPTIVAMRISGEDMVDLVMSLHVEYSASLMLS